MKNTCKNCTFWYNPRMCAEVMHEAVYENWGLCHAISCNMEVGKTFPRDHLPAMSISTAEGIGTELYTKATFGCNLFA